jgi:hypothetical protein
MKNIFPNFKNGLAYCNAGVAAVNEEIVCRIGSMKAAAERTYSIARHRSYALSKVRLGYGSCTVRVSGKSETSHATRCSTSAGLTHENEVQALA